MPTYEYKCDACGHAFEKFQMMSAEPIKVCPSCGKQQVRRLIGIGSGMIFKGSGFYITDYRDAAYKDKAKADAPATTPAAETAPASKEAGKSSDGSKDSKTPASPAPAPAPAATSTLTPASSTSGSSPPASKSKSHD